LDEAHLGPITLFKYQACGVKRIVRNIQHIRENGIDDFIIGLPLDASVNVSQGGLSLTVEPGSFTFLTTLKPFEATCRSEINEFIVRIPGSMLRRYVPHMDICCDLPIKIRPGASALMATLFDHAHRNAKFLDEGQARWLGFQMMESIAKVADEAPELRDFDVGRLRDSSYTRVIQRAMDFIQSNLSDPQLTTKRVAEHCRVSIRYLHSAFESRSLTVGGYIREERLLHCQVALKNPLLKYKSVLDIAMNWGFGSHGSFSSAYKKRFHLSPRHDRT
jgi:AraC-like DNA-binding protein